MLWTLEDEETVRDRRLGRERVEEMVEMEVMEVMEETFVPLSISIPGLIPC